MKKMVSAPSPGSEAEKKKYQSPELRCYGHVAQLTKGGTGSGADAGGTGPHTKHCWIAEVIYGIDAPRTLLVRGWLTECYERREPWSMVVVPLYGCFGQHVAAIVRRYPILKSVFRPLFDIAVQRAHKDRAATLRVASRAANLAA